MAPATIVDRITSITDTPSIVYNDYVVYVYSESKTPYAGSFTNGSHRIRALSSILSSVPLDDEQQRSF